MTQRHPDELRRRAAPSVRPSPDAWPEPAWPEPGGPPTRRQQRVADRGRRRVSARVRRRRSFAVLLTVSLVAGLWAWGPELWSGLRSPWRSGGPGAASALAAAGPRTTPTPTATVQPKAAPAGVDGESEAPGSEGGADETGNAPANPVRPLPKGLTAADVAAGVLSDDVPQHGNGRLFTVPGSAEAPGKGTVFTVRVRVEGGLKVDRELFAAFALKTLNDDRSWGHGGKKRFARTEGKADITVVLASPSLSAQLCRPLITGGTLSCRQGDQAILTLYRWVKAIPGYGQDRTGYRQYVVNHEVGHALGHGHEFCSGAGRLAPVMMQQTKGLGACEPNPWPHP